MFRLVYSSVFLLLIRLCFLDFFGCSFVCFFTTVTTITCATYATSFTFTVDGLSSYIGKYITMKHNGEAVSTQMINGDSVSFAYTGSFSPFTFVITDAPAQTATSPQTSKTALTGALVCVAAMAIIGTAVASKRKFD